MKPKIVLSVLFTSIIILSCKSDEVNPETGTRLLRDRTIMIDGIEREYHIQLPQNPAKKPLVLLLHGHGGSSDQSIGDNLNNAPQKVWLSLAEDNDFIVVVANGVLGPLGSRGWNDCRNDAPGNPDTDDVAFLSQLIDKIKAEYNHDNDRVYVAGVSNGASMAIRLAQEINEKIAAFVSIITTMAGNSECLDSNIPISALFMNGTADPLAPYDGGQVASNRGLVLSTDESIDYWVSRNNTDTNPIETPLDNIDNNDNSTVVKYLYTNGTNNTEVVLYKVIDGGHAEPSLQERYGNLFLAIVGVQNGDIEMAHEVWDFFKTKSK